MDNAGRQFLRFFFSTEFTNKLITFPIFDRLSCAVTVTRHISDQMSSNTTSADIEELVGSQSDINDQGLSKRALKRIKRKAEWKEKQKEKYKDISKNPNPGFSADLFEESEYYVENGLRKVYPYYFTFQSYCKGRWVGKTISELYQNEFVMDNGEMLGRSISEQKAMVNGKPILPDYVLRNGDFIEHTLHRHENPVLACPIEIIKDTEDLLVINKPPSMPCHPCGRYRFNSVMFILGKEYGFANLRGIYRLDRLTSGVLIFGKKDKITKTLMNQVVTRSVQKEYVARVEGHFPDGVIKVEQPIDAMSQKLGLRKVSANGKPSSTSFERLSFNGTSSVVKCWPHTGRTHQIRVHLQFLGHPIVNDPFYNADVWGPEKGKGGIFTVPEDEINTALMATHNVGLWVADGENLLYQQRLDEIKEQEKRDNCSGKAENNHSEEPESKKLKTDDVYTADKDSNVCYNLSERSHDNDSAALAGEKATEFGSESSTKIMPSSCDARKTATMPGAFESEKWIPCEHCDNCPKKFIDPRRDELLIYLHALSYKGPDWEYSTNLPEWAKEDWIENTYS